MLSYHRLLETVLAKGVPHKDRTGVGTVSLFGYEWRHDMADGFPLISTKFVPLRLVFEELMWFLRGQTDEKILQEKKVHIWSDWATAEKCAKFGRSEGELGPVYGSLFRNFGGWDTENDINIPGRGVDQIARLLEDLRTNPNSRRLIVSGWNPETVPLVELPPCHTLWQLKAYEDGGLSLRLTQRSQ